MRQGRRWTVGDAWGNAVYLTDERWEHICERHPEMLEYEASLRETIRRGRRWQDPLNPRKYYYRLRVPGLPFRSTHIEAVVLLRMVANEQEAIGANNYVTTAYPKVIRR